jgi:hypothetical protein
MKPTFFIVGAPKCGTTAMAQYLAEHPNVYISPIKEPHYFAEDLPKYRVASTLAEYEALFSDASAQHLHAGEGSVFYLVSEVAIRKIMIFDPSARLIVMLRNPVEMVHSLHAQLLYSRDESVSDFDAAWRMIAQRRDGRRVPAQCRAPKLLEYDSVGRYGAQLERLLASCPREQVLVLLYEDFCRDPAAAYRAVIDFLGLPKDARTDFPVINAHKQHKFAWMGQFTQKTPSRLVDTALRVKTALGIQRLGILDRLRRINQSNKPRAPLSVALRQEIVECYRDDVTKLASLTGRDLAGWLR